jgi:hypothetical protein
MANRETVRSNEFVRMMQPAQDNRVVNARGFDCQAFPAAPRPKVNGVNDAAPAITKSVYCQFREPQLVIYCLPSCLIAEFWSTAKATFF